MDDEFHHYAKMLLIVRRQPFTAGEERWTREEVQLCLTEIFAPHRCWVFPAQTPKQFLVLVNRPVLDMYSSVYECLESARRHLHDCGIDAMLGGQVLSPEPEKLPELYHRVSSILNERQRIMKGECWIRDFPFLMRSRGSRDGAACGVRFRGYDPRAPQGAVCA